MQGDMKLQIAKAGERLLKEKNRKKLTVTDIVEECHITRQTFYYHFKDIPDMVLWGLKQRFDIVFEQISEQNKIEKIIECCLITILESREWMEKIFSTNYGETIAKMLIDSMIESLLETVTQKNVFPEASEMEKRVILSYYSYAFMGVIREWDSFKTEDTYKVAKLVVDLMSGQIRFFDGKLADKLKRRSAE